MGLAEDIANDWEFIDGIETVSVTSQADGATAITGVKALQRASDRLARSFGTSVAITPNDVVFELWPAESGLTDIVPGDKITNEAGVNFTIMTAQLLTLKTRWRCVCRRFTT